jgi:NAD(P)-dependent dehydrogenase (short-subunit alcohol dehydrogenase family)
VAVALASAGADVAVSFRESEEGAAETAEAVRRLGRRAFVASADARHPGQMAGFVDDAARALGGLDVLVNCLRAELEGSMLISLLHP